MRLLTVFLLAVLLAGCESFGMGHGKMNTMTTATNKIMVFLDQDRECPLYVKDLKSNGDPAARCPAAGTRRSDAACRSAGDPISWRLTGSELLMIEFEGGTPTGWTCDTKAGNPFGCEIAEDAPEGSSYKYSVTVGDCELDPYIIIN